MCCLRSDQSLSHIQLLATPCTTARQASPSCTISRSLLKLTSIELVMPFNHLLLCCPLLLLPSIIPNISSVQFSHSVMSNSLQPHEQQHTQPPSSITPSRNSAKPMSIELEMPSNHFILCNPLILLPSIFPIIGSSIMSQIFA